MTAATSRRLLHSPPASVLCLALAAMFVDDARAAVLDRIRVSRSGAEAAIEIEFMCAMHYVGHRAAGFGDLLAIDVSPGDDCLVALQDTHNELRRPIPGRMAALREIEFDRAHRERPTLTLRFERPVAFRVSQSMNRHMLTVLVDTDFVTATAPPPPAPAPAPAVPQREPPPTADRVSRRIETPEPVIRDRFVIRAAVYDGADAVDPKPVSIDDARLAYVNPVSVGERRWAELRIGFFDEERDAEEALARIRLVYPSAWIAVAAPDEQARAASTSIDLSPGGLGGDKQTAGAAAAATSAASAAAATAARSATPSSPATTTSPARAVVAGGGAALSAEEQTALFTEARAALLRGEHADAISAYTRLLEAPDASRHPEARELLGVALEKSGRADRARAEYRAWLRDYGTSADAARVRQRLATITVANQPVQAVSAPRPDPRPAARNDGWTLAGGLSQFYLRGVSLGADSRPDVVAESALLSQAQFAARRRGQRFDLEARGNVGLLYDFEDEDEAIQVYVSSAWIDVADTETDFDLRIGRQHLPRSGVLTRFDGIDVGYRLRPDLKLKVTTGLPIDTPRFRATADSYFYGASVDAEGLLDLIDVSAFAMEQRIGGLLDRRAVGGEARYRNRRLNVVGLIDYDPSFNLLNTAGVTAVYQAHDRLTLHGRWRGGAAPFLTTRNALIGQPFDTVRELEAFYSEGQIRRLARNRTAEERAGAVGLSAALTPRLQFEADFSYLEYGATVASGGVDAYPGTGPQYSWSANLIGSGFLDAASTFIAGYRHDERRSIDDDTLWFDFRLPIGDRFRLQTRLEATRRVENQNSAGDVVQWLGRPVLRLWYAAARRFRLELEVGGQLSERDFPPPLAPPGIVDVIEQSDYYLQLGYFVDF